jgi:hypothetical protein
VAEAGRKNCTNESLLAARGLLRSFVALKAALSWQRSFDISLTLPTEAGES